MPLIPQQTLVVITGPYTLARDQKPEEAAAAKLQAVLETYPPCRIVSVTGSGTIHGYSLTAVVETI